MERLWTVELIGHPFDLGDLVRWTSGNQIRVEKVDDDRFRLAMPTSVVGEPPEGVRAKASAYIDLLNGFGSVQEPTFERVTLGKSAALDLVNESGAVVNRALGLDGVTARTRGGRPGVENSGNPVPDPTVGIAERFLGATKKSTAAGDAMLILGRGRPTWSELYLVYELVKANTSGSVEDRGWISANDLDLFKRTVNDYSALGVEARHGPKGYQPPPEPMTHYRALELIRALVLKWLTAQVKT